MLHVRIFDLFLRGDVVERVVVSSFGGAEEGGGVMRNEARLPAFLEILSRIADQIFVGNERPAKVDQVTDRRAHSDRIPPRRINLDAWIGKIARHHQH